MPQHPALLSLASRAYALLLHAYPASFRREYGDHMAQVFRDDLRATLQEQGPIGVIARWFIAVVDLAKTAAAEHMWEVFHMSTHNLARWSGPAAVLGGLLFCGAVALVALGNPEGNDLGMGANLGPIGAVALSLPFLALGVYGLYQRLPSRTAAANTLTFAAAEVGLLLFVGGVLLLFTTDLVGTAMIMIAGGAAILGVGVAGLGVIALVTGSLGRWGVVPLILGAGHIVITLTMAQPPQNAVGVVILANLAGWLLLGAALWTYQGQRVEPGLPA